MFASSSSMQSATDEALARKYHENFKDHPRFSASNKQVRLQTSWAEKRTASLKCCAHCHVQKAASQFAVRHYAGEVIYGTVGFIDKNKDTIHK
jgi:hypothetical protein